MWGKDQSLGHAVHTSSSSALVAAGNRPTVLELMGLFYSSSRRKKDVTSFGRLALAVKGAGEGESGLILG